MLLNLTCNLYFCKEFQKVNFVLIDSKKDPTTNKQKTGVQQKKDGPPAVGMYSPTRPTDETKDKQDETPENVSFELGTGVNHSFGAIKLAS